MRGDYLRDLGVPLCFMLRFALLVPNDPTIESTPIKYTQLMPSMNEDEMKSRDYTSSLPFMVLPGLDQDIDVDSSDMNRFEAIMNIFSKKHTSIADLPLPL